MSLKNYIWESFEFPITITSISCELGRHNFPSDSIIEINRDAELKFIAKVHGKTNDVNVGEYHHPSHQNKSGEFIEGENIVGYDRNNTKFILKGCHVKNVSFAAINDPLFHSYFTLEIRIDHLTELLNNNQDNVECLMEWFLTGRTDILFSRNTRYYTPEGVRIRKDLDINIHEDKLSGVNICWDYMLIKLKEFSFVVQKVQNGITPSWANGFVIEYRNSLGKIPSEKNRIAIAEIISFMFGIEFMNIGYSEFNDNNEIIRRLGRQAYGNNLIARCKNFCMSPIEFPTQRGRIDTEDMLSQIVDTYLNLRKDLNLNTVLWKYWLAKNSAIGINLPVLSSAIEGVAESYLKLHNIIPKPDKEIDKKYKELLKDNSQFIEALKAYGFGKTVINKIENPYNFGMGEKLSLFFNSLDIILEKNSIENEALKSRNKMTHSSSSIDSDDKAKQAIRMTRAYETLFNRTLLKILGYNGKYIDYYTIGHPERNLSDNIDKDV